MKPLMVPITTKLPQFYKEFFNPPIVGIVLLLPAMHPQQPDPSWHPIHNNNPKTPYYMRH
jgi:hypothetical protein